MSGTSQVILIPLFRARIVVRNSKDFLAGLFFLGAGLFFLLLAQSYSIGEASRMGPGYFPFWVGAVLALLGVAIALQSISTKAQIQQWPNINWRNLFWVLGSTTTFGLILSHAGLVCSLIVLVSMASRASPGFTWRATFGTTAVIVAISLVAFVWLLRVDIPTWPTIFAS